MRLRHIKGCEKFIEQASECMTENELINSSEKWKALLVNEAPLHIEIGCGKGQFIRNMSQKYPEINFIGIEKYMSILMKAIQRKRTSEKENNINYKNLLFACADARNLDKIFAENEVDKIYLNFSDPWPKLRHAERRLTSSFFLNIYNKILVPEGCLEFKTDNTKLFDYSLQSIAQNKWHILYKTYDLHSAYENNNNIMSEYEEKFSKTGKKICMFRAEPVQPL